MSTLFDAIECFWAVFSLVPVSALALGTLPKDKIADAAGVHSLSKCVTGSKFTFLAASFTIRLSQEFDLMNNLLLLSLYPLFHLFLVLLNMVYLLSFQATLLIA